LNVLVIGQELRREIKERRGLLLHCGKAGREEIPPEVIFSVTPGFVITNSPQSGVPEPTALPLRLLRRRDEHAPIAHPQQPPQGCKDFRPHFRFDTVLFVQLLPMNFSDCGRPDSLRIIFFGRASLSRQAAPEARKIPDGLPNRDGFADIAKLRGLPIDIVTHTEHNESVPGLRYPVKLRTDDVVRGQSFYIPERQGLAVVGERIEPVPERFKCSFTFGIIGERRFKISQDFLHD
jgi:hypothetical protein